jgi:hypothetical protein
LIPAGDLLGHAEISDFDVAGCVEEDVGGLDVAVEDVFLVVEVV